MGFLSKFWPSDSGYFISGVFPISQYEAASNDLKTIITKYQDFGHLTR